MARVLVGPLCVALVAGFVCPRGAWADEGAAREVASTGAQAPDDGRAQAMITKAIAFLRLQQDKTSGGWGVHEGAPVFPAITGLVVQGMLMEPGVTDADASVAAGVAFMLKHQQADGGIYAGMLPSYNTAICLSALSKVNSPAEVADAKARALAFLRSIQYGEGAVAYESLKEAAASVDASHPYYGGWGYGRHGRPDLSNTQFAVEALHAAHAPDDDPAFARAVAFLQRCQMLESAAGKPVNDLAYAKGSSQGGFIYSTSVNKDMVGVGQSTAGEVAESLSGEPGHAGVVKLKAKGEDGKPVTLTREEITKRIQDRMMLSSNFHVGGMEYIVVLGSTSDGIHASDFEVRSSITGATALRQFEIVLGQAFRDVVENAESIKVREVAAWKGESRLRCYGSMTYAGFKSYLYAGLSKQDPRVLAAREWISNNYTLEVNPGGLSTDGLYYYLLTFAKAMDAYGEDELLARGPGEQEELPTRRVWKRDLIARLSQLQNEDGSFKAVDDRWMENDPVLITAYALQALEVAR